MNMGDVAVQVLPVQVVRNLRNLNLRSLNHVELQEEKSSGQSRIKVTAVCGFRGEGSCIPGRWPFYSQNREEPGQDKEERCGRNHPQSISRGCVLAEVSGNHWPPRDSDSTTTPGPKGRATSPTHGTRELQNNCLRYLHLYKKT